MKNDLRLRCFKKHRATELTEANKVARLHRARQLLAKYPASLVNFIVFTDEKVFTAAPQTNSHNDLVYAYAGTATKQIVAPRLSRSPRILPSVVR